MPCLLKSGDDGNRTRTNRSTICRAKPLTLRHRVVNRVAQVGVEPTASLVLSQGGLPVAYRAVVSDSTQNRTRTCKHPGLSRIALPVGVSRPESSWVDSNHRSSPCKGAAFAARPQDRCVSCQLSVETSRNRRWWFAVAHCPLPTAYCQKSTPPRI